MSNRPIAEFNSTFLENMSSLMSLHVSKSEVDETGKSPKFTLASKVTYSLQPDNSAGTIHATKTMLKKAFLSIGIPTSAAIKCTQGMPDVYSHPAVKMAHYNIEGGIKDSAADTNFYNRVVGVTGCFGTAAAMQMAFYYTQGYVLPKLGLGGGIIQLAGVGNDGKEVVDTDDISSYLANELILRHKPEVLTLVYHATEAKDILGMAGFDATVKRTMNRAGNLPSIELDLELFYEAYFILRHSLCGDEDGSQFDCDFLVALTQMYPVHGVSDEGGVWRRIWEGTPVTPNSMVVTSTAAPFSVGYGVVRDGAFIAAAAKLQCLVARAVRDYDMPIEQMMLPAGATMAMVDEVLLVHRAYIAQVLAEATGKTKLYWQSKLCNVCMNADPVDRHISDVNINLLCDACPFLPSYAHSAISGSSLGAVDVVMTSSEPVRMTGSYSIDRAIAHGQVIYEYDTHKPRNFKNGLMFLDPKINQDDGLMELTLDSFEREKNGAMLAEVELADGNTLQANNMVGQKMWRDNGDFIPCAGELRTVDAGKLNLVGYTVPAWAESGKYCVTASPYVSIGKENGEKNVPGKTRRELSNVRSGLSYSVLDGCSRVKAPTLTAFLSRWQKASGHVQKVIIARLNKAKKARAEWVQTKVQTKVVNWDSPSVDEVEEIKDEWLARCTEVDKTASAIAELNNKVETGKVNLIDDEFVKEFDALTMPVGVHAFKAISVSAIVHTDEKGTRTTPAEWGLIKGSRKFDPLQYRSELQTLLSEVLDASNRTFESGNQVISVLAGKADQQEFSNKYRNEHKRVWDWTNQVATAIDYADKKSYNPLAAVAKKIEMELSTTTVTEPAEIETPDN